MKNKKIVIALGGNALGNNPDEQREALKITSRSIVNLIEQGYKIVVGHGNGPQVGMISLAFNEGRKANNRIPEMPLSLIGAMSQGYIGLQLQQSIKNELNKRGILRNVVSLITQVIVDKNDDSFLKPSKPIGLFYSEKEAMEIAKINNWIFKEDSGRGWRRFVPSPKPIDIVEKDIIKNLFDDGTIVIAGGGGGIPTLIKDKKFKDIDAVIDKDFTSQKLAELIEADIFMIVTAVDGIMKNFGKETEEKIDFISPNDLKLMIESNVFPEGSMKPKVISVYHFVKNTKKKALITSLEKAGEAIKGNSGTTIQ